MAEQRAEQREAVQQALLTFPDKPLEQGAIDLLATLGYRSDKTANLGRNAESFLRNIQQFRPDIPAIDRKRVCASDWVRCGFLFQLTNDEIPSLTLGQLPFGTVPGLLHNQIESFVFAAIELNGQHWSRSRLGVWAAVICRARVVDRLPIRRDRFGPSQAPAGAVNAQKALGTPARLAVQVGFAHLCALIGPSWCSCAADSAPGTRA